MIGQHTTTDLHLQTAVILLVRVSYVAQAGTFNPPALNSLPQALGPVSARKKAQPL
jgi:hypothetical protein